MAPLSVIDVPTYVAVKAEFAAKPEPETVTADPALPLVGFRNIDGVTVNIALAAFKRESVVPTVFPPAV